VPGRGKPAGKDSCQGRRAKDYDRLSEPRILLYVEPGMISADLSVLVVKVRTLCRVKTIRIAASAVMDGWDGRYRAVSSFGFENDFQRKCVSWKYRKGTGKMWCRPHGDGRGFGM
jgi:hypothetical protein